MPRLLLAVLVLALAACSTAPDGAARSSPAPSPSTPSPSTPSPSTPSPAAPSPSAAPADDDEQAYVGLTEQEALARAQAEGRTARVTSRDGEQFPQTMDLQERRLNLVVEDGKVTQVRLG